MLFLEGYWPTQDSQRAALVMTGILLLFFLHLIDFLLLVGNSHAIQHI